MAAKFRFPLKLQILDQAEEIKKLEDQMRQMKPHNPDYQFQKKVKTKISIKNEFKDQFKKKLKVQKMINKLAEEQKKLQERYTIDKSIRSSKGAELTASQQNFRIPGHELSKITVKVLNREQSLDDLKKIRTDISSFVKANQETGLTDLQAQNFLNTQDFCISALRTHSNFNKSS